MKYIIGVDIGGTNIRAGLVAPNGKITSKIKARTETKKGQKAVLRKIIDIIETFPIKKVDSIGLGVPGMIDAKNGIVKYSPNLPLKNVNIRKLIEKEFKKPVFVDNDANCFTLAEAKYGAAKNKKNVIGLTLGTGVGSGIVIDGKLYHGRGNAAELGHTTINFNGPKAKCGNNGCVESYVSIRGILNRVKGLYIKNPKELFELAEQKNKKALKLWQDTGSYLGVAIANFANIFDPDAIVIGGNIANAWKFFSKEMNKTIKKRALVKDIKVIRSKLGEDAGILGAASLCFS
ncbi:ROK family protein [Candidatus Woesearchaeota archaeon]|nr:ROK family protein [Candidatus Woesearchaeota archaeon]